MKKLTSDLKRMLSALAHADAGEHLSRTDKMSFLKTGHVPTHTPVYSSIKSKPAQKRKPQVAVIFDGHASDAVIDYLLTTPFIFNTDIHILAHGDDVKLQEKTSTLSLRLRKSGRKSTTTFLLEEMADAFQEFCNDHPDLQCLLAPKDDLLAKEIIENPEFHSHSHKIPLILIQDSDRKTAAMVTAA